jgi:hypothetical protein
MSRSISVPFAQSDLIQVSQSSHLWRSSTEKHVGAEATPPRADVGRCGIAQKECNEDCCDRLVGQEAEDIVEGRGSEVIGAEGWCEGRWARKSLEMVDSGKC